MARRKAAGGGRLSKRQTRASERRPKGHAHKKSRGFSRQVAISALEALSDALILCDASGRVVFLNKAAIDLYGGPESDPSMRKCAHAYGVFHADGRTLLTAEELPLFRALQGETLRDVDLVVRPPLTGKICKVRANAMPLWSATGDIVGAAVLSRLRAHADIGSAYAARPELSQAASLVPESDHANRKWLQSWKQIAEYVGRTARTIQRWEALGFPVRRPTGKQRSAVMASTTEIDEWLSSRPRFMKTRSARIE